MSRPKPYTVEGEPNAQTIELIDRMLAELYEDLGGFNPTHTMLSVTHTDTTPAAAVRGDLIVAALDASLATTWQRFSVGAASTVLRTGGTDPVWGKVVLTTDVTGTLPVTNGGLGLATVVQGDILYASAADTLSRLAKNTTASRYLSNQGASNNPLWAQISLTDGVTGILPLLNGGFGFSSATDGSLPYFNSAAVSKLAIGTSGKFLVASAGLPNWSNWTMPDTSNLVVGDLLQASTTTAMAALAAVATGNVLISGGIGVVSAWGKVALTTHVSGVLPLANGGTNSGTGIALLDGVVHNDTVAQAVSRGSLIYGNSTPKWDKLALGSAGKVLTSDGTDSAWTLPHTEQTTTSTGTQNDFSLSAHSTYLRCNNASALTITGFTIGGATPINGDRVIVENVGSSTVKLGYQTGSTAANQTLTPSTTGQIIGAKGIILCVYDATTNRWRCHCIDPGAPIAVAYAGLAFTGTGTLVWTVASGDLITMSYQQQNNTLFAYIRITTSTVSGAGNTLIVSESSLIPGGFTLNAALTAALLGIRVIDNGNTTTGFINVSAGYRFTRSDTANWAAATDTTQVDATLTLLVD